MSCLIGSIRRDIEASSAEHNVPVKQYCIYNTNYIEQCFENQLLISRPVRNLTFS